MKKCHRCGIFVDSDSSNCPLCGAFIKGERAHTVYEYPEIQLKIKQKRLLRCLIFFSVLAIGTVAVIDFSVNQTIGWSLHPIFGILLLWFCIGRPILKRFNVRKHLSWGFFGVIALLCYLNYQISDFAPPWAFTLAMPIVILVWQTGLEILAFFHRDGRSDYEISLTKVFLLSAVGIGVSFLWLGACQWGFYVAAGRGAIDVAFLCFFGKDVYFGELKKRLHV